MPALSDEPAERRLPEQDRIIVIGGSARTLDMLRIAAIRSDDVVLFMDCPEAPIQRFADMFAVDVKRRRPLGADLEGSSAVLVASDEPGTDDWALRTARRRDVPIYVVDRPLVSDFTLMQLVERHPSTLGGQRRGQDR